LRTRFALPINKATTDSDYTTFLKYFGEFKIVAVETKEVSGQEYIIEEMQLIKSMLRDIAIRDISSSRRYFKNRNAHSGAMVIIKNISEDEIDELINVVPSIGRRGMQYDDKDLTLHFGTTSFDELLDIEELISNKLKSMNVNPQISVAWG
jgi:hypothetical protein